jgi:ATP-dependent Lhr-like helicase
MKPIGAVASDPRDLFDPLIARWFSRSVGTPTEVQARAWPLIARGSHVLVSAPTGTGKTLTAFLWAIDRLVRGEWTPGKVRVLYVSPLKALNNDIQRNLMTPLEGISREAGEAGREIPSIRVLTRSGDTPASERRSMLRRPPEILITTPESLNLILSSPNARMMLDGVHSVILDEIHAVASTKRGTHLVTAVERLAGLCGEFQRIALSATVRPLSVVADFIGGFIMEGGAEAPPTYRKRLVEVVSLPLSKRYEIKVSMPGAGRGQPSGQAAFPPDGPEDTMWSALAAECTRIIRENRSTLFFVNSRRHAERLARMINEGEGAQKAWSHHGSLSKELRLLVEQKLKQGELSAIVATSSLELGIDIGVLDKVVLVQTPFSVSSAVQRIGRAGHRVGEASKADVFPLFGKDLVDSAVTVRAILSQDIEEASPIICPLDVLAQVMVSMAGVETWKTDDLFNAVRASYPFNSLIREHFDLVLSMLCGKYSETRLRELSPLLSLDALEGTVRARDAALPRLYSSGGTITDRGYFSMRTADTKALIGELDEEFVWERAIGDSFFFGTQGWRIEKIDHQNVEVAPVKSVTAMAPFWKAEEVNRGFHVSERISQSLERWNGMLEDPALGEELVKENLLSPESAEALVGFLSRQREVTGTDLPHRHHLLVEYTKSLEGNTIEGGTEEERTGCRVILHTLWGGRVNRPYSLALSAAWEEKFGYPPEMVQDDDAILLLLSENVPASRIASLVTAENVERLLRKRLEGSGFFGARFRENASRALLLPRASLKKRMPLWFARLRARNLYSAVSKYDDFPMILETWRTCLRDEFDMRSLGMLLAELADGRIRVGEAHTAAPSPLTSGLLWKQTNTYMYRDDTPHVKGGTALRPDLIRELALSTELRPLIKPEVAAEFQEKLQRTAPGYAPRGALELLDWVKERLLIPSEEWGRLLQASASESGMSVEELAAALAGKITPLLCGITAKENEARTGGAVEKDDDAMAEILSQWLRFYAPVEPGFVRGVFSLDEERFQGIVQDLVEEELVVVDRLRAGTEEILMCDRENLESLLRISRARARPAFRALPARLLPLWVAHRQGLTRKAARAEDMKDVWEKLFGFGLPARLWEEEVFPARLEGYTASWLDSLFVQGGLLWLGCGKERLLFCFPEDAELFMESRGSAEELERLFPGRAGRYGFWELLDRAGISTQALSESLWRLAWRGRASSDSFQLVRQGIENRFRVTEVRDKGRPRRAGFNRWQTSRPSKGSWFRVDAGSASGPPWGAEPDAMEREEANRDRIRQVLRRYGVVWREVLENELPPLRWGALFRSLRIMELGGEIVSGRFFEGIQGLQFASPEAFEELKAGLPEEAVYWVNAADPASLCGAEPEALRGVLPPRVPSTHVVFRGGEVALVSRRHGRELEMRVPVGDPALQEYLGVFRVMVDRDVRPLSAVHVETINGEPAPRSPYAKSLLTFGFQEDYKRLTLRGGI